MPSFTLKKHVNAPPEVTFEHATDLEKAPERVEGITKMEILTDGPVGEGTRFRETRVMMKKEHSEEMEITAFDPPRSYAVDAESCGCKYHTVFHFRPAGDGTEIEMTFDAKPLNIFAKVMSVVMRPMFGWAKREMQKDLDQIAASAEAAGEVAAG